MSVSRRSLALLLTACAFGLVGAACGGDGERSAEDVPPDAIALIGDQEVPESEFQAIIDRAEKSYKAQKRPFPKVGSPEYQDLKNRAVSFLVQRYQFRAEAEEMGIEVTEEDIDKRLAKVTKESFEGDEAKLTKELERIGLSQEQAREQLRDLIIQEKIFEEVTKNVKVTDAQVRAYYKKNEAIEDVFVDYLEARKLPLVPLPFGGGSDHAPFASRGIATGGLFTGAGGRKTEEQARTFGGRAGQPYDACYHERCDDLENVNLEELHELADAAAHGIATFAAKPSLLE